jgi:hypothetical protein
MTQTSQADAPSPNVRPRRFHGTHILVAIGLICALLAACGRQGQPTRGPADSSPYPGWHAITAPTGDPLGVYVSSPTVPGLMLACIGMRLDQPGQAQFGPAHLWRTRDYGARWQQLTTPVPLRSGCGAILIRGSSDLVMVFDWQSQALLISPDVGDTWKPGRPPLFPNEDAPNRAKSMAYAIYRDGRLYTLLYGDFGAGVLTRFASSDDDGLTWTLLDDVPPAANDDLRIQTDIFAPDYSTPRAWFRTSLHAKKDASLPHFTTLDRSTDDGRTWTTLSKIAVAGVWPPQYSSPLVTNPGLPGRLCLGLSKATTVTVAQQPVSDLVMGSSDDGGARWRYAQITHVSTDDPHVGSVDGWMDAQGNCYAVTFLAYNDPPSTTSDLSLVKWPAAPGAEPYVAARVTLPASAKFSTIVGAAPGKQRILATLSSGPPSAPRLYWTDVAV